MRSLCLAVGMTLCVGIAHSQTPSAPAVPPPSQEQLRKAVSDLSNTRFAVREKASKVLWEAGRSAESILREAAKGGDEEAVNRCKSILEKFDWGIYPDTRPEVLKLIEKFRGGDQTQRHQVLGELMLVKPTQFATLRKLIARETNPEIQQELYLLLSVQARAAVPALIVGNQLDEASELLEICISKDNPIAMADYAAMAFLRKQLASVVARYESEAVKQKGDDRKRSFETLAYLYRASANWAAANKAAKNSENKLLQTDLYWEASDWKSLSESPLTEENPEDDSRGQKAAYYRKAGNKAKYDETIADIRKDLTGIEGDDLTAKRISKALLLNGEGGEAIKLLKERPGTASIIVFDLLCAQLKFQEAFAFADKALKSIEIEEDADVRQLELNIRRVIILANLGEVESATQLCRKQFELLQAKPELAGFILSAAKDLSRANQRELALECVARVAKAPLGRGREQIDVETLFEFLFEEKSVLPIVWFKAIRGIEKEGDFLDQFRRVDKLVSGKGSAKDVTLLEKALSGKPATIFPGAREPNSPETNAYALAELHRLHGDMKKAEAAFNTALKLKEGGFKQPKIQLPRADLFEEDAPNESSSKVLYMSYADFLSKLGKHSEAAPFYEKAWNEVPFEPLPLFLQGQSLIKAGDTKKGNALVEAAHYVPLSEESIRVSFADELNKRGYAEDSKREMQLVLDVGWFRTYQVGNVHLRMARQLARKKDFAKAAEYYEKDVISLFRTGATFQDPRAFLSVPELARSYRLRAMLAAGNVDDALKEAKQSLDLLPGNVELAIDFVPELDKAGRKADGDALYKQLRNAYEGAIKDFSNSADLKNSVAWVMVNCNRDLEDAKNHAEKAVKLRPDSAGYIDTLAEIHFRLKDRPKALELMKKCAEIEPKNPYYRKQLERFEKKGFDSMPLDEETGDD